MEKNIYIIRHGETDYNKKGIIQGSGIDADLNIAGREQARQFYEYYRNIPFDKIYTSHLKRTQQTVEQFTNNNIKWEKLSDFNEMNWGIYEGAIFTTSVKKKIIDIINTWKQGNYDHKAVEAESPIEVYKRLKRGINYILTQKDEKNVLLCIHGRVLLILLCLLNNVELKNMNKFKHQNLGLYLTNYNYNSQNFNFKLINDISHLKQVN